MAGCKQGKRFGTHLRTGEGGGGRVTQGRGHGAGEGEGHMSSGEVLSHGRMLPYNRGGAGRGMAVLWATWPSSVRRTRAGGWWYGPTVCLGPGGRYPRPHPRPAPLTSFPHLRPCTPDPRFASSRRSSTPPPASTCTPACRPSACLSRWVVRYSSGVGSVEVGGGLEPRHAARRHG